MVNNWKKISEQGSMMVEALAMLGLITMVTPVLYKKAAERTTELQDINTATQLRALSKALDGYMKDNYDSLANEGEGNLEVSPDDVKAYLPYNFQLESKSFGEYDFVIKNETVGSDLNEHAKLTGVVLAPLANAGDLSMLRASKIASMVGANAGVVRSNAIQGVQGGWSSSLSNLGFSNAPDGSLAVSSVHAVSDAGDNGAAPESVLYRDFSRGDTRYNTMMTNLIMGAGTDILNVQNVVAQGGGGGTMTLEAGEVIMTTDASVAGLLEAGRANVGDIFKANVEDGVVDITGATTKIKPSETVNVESKEVTIKSTDQSKGVVISGKTTINENVVIHGESDPTGKPKGLIEAKRGIVASGATGVKDSDSVNTEYSLVSDGNVLVKNNAYIVGKLRVKGEFSADEVYGRTTLGGGALSGDVPYNFTATKDDVHIENPKFSVGPENEEKLLVDEKQAKMIGGTVQIIADSETNEGSISTQYVKVGASGQQGYIDAKDAKVIADAGTKTAEMSAASGSNTAKVVVNANTLQAQLLGIKGEDVAKVSVDANTGAAELSGTKDGKSAGVYASTSTQSAELKAVGDYTASVKVDASSGAIEASSGTAKMKLDSSGAKLGSVSGETWKNYVEVSDEIALLKSGNAAFEIKGKNAKLVGNDLENLVINNSITDSDTGLLSFTDENTYANRTSGVRINRSGIIQLPAASGSGRSDLATSSGKQGVAGYIKADRLLANQGWVDPVYARDGYFSHQTGEEADEEASNPYDAYQVNPAYTSVMHDIKLTTRGGARLSDILPDFINKGIYVLDNTYKEEDDNKDWSAWTVNPTAKKIDDVVNGEPDTCHGGDMDCIASPWLGFVPTPQCPPGYSKVITINPIRWKMSEAYFVVGATSTSGNYAAKFRSYFRPLTDPSKAAFKLSTADGSGAHSHYPEEGLPLTFQTNTWLNTTVSGVYYDGTSTSDVGGGQRKSTFVGWHAIMGFLYFADDYRDYLEHNLGHDYYRAGEPDSLEGKIAWNLFPVYNEEMAAIASVYCYFERRDMTGPTWQWNRDIVDGGPKDGGGPGYDQLTNFRFGFYKDGDYRKRLNDPALEYDEAW